MIRSFIQIATRFHNNRIISTPALVFCRNNFNAPFIKSMTQQQVFTFAKLSKKQKEKQKSDQEKKKIKEQIGDTSSFDLNPIEERLQQIVQAYKNTIANYKVGRLDPSLFQNIYVKIGHNSLPIHQLAQVAPKTSNSCILNPFDHDTLDIIQKGVQASDMGFQVARVDKTILVTQPPNSMKQIKQKMLEKLKKNSQNFKQKLSRVRTDSRQELKKYKKIIPEQRYKIIEKQLNTLYQKFVASYQKLAKQKQIELKK